VVQSSTQRAQRRTVCRRCTHRPGSWAARTLDAARPFAAACAARQPRRSDGAAQRECSGQPVFTRAAVARARRFRPRFRAGTSARKR
jgi:hypothetical protein